MQKRGISHVEFILSFVIFVVAVSFALYLFNPGNTPRLADTYLDYTFKEISRNSSVNVETFSVVLNENEIVGESAIAIEFEGIGGKTRVETYAGAVLNSSKVGDVVYIQKPTAGWPDFVFVKFCDDFDEASVSPVSLNETFYEISSSNIKEVLSEKRLLKIKENYEASYDELKGRGRFNLPDTVNFAFSLTYDDGQNISVERNIPAGLEVFSDSRRMEVLKQTGEIVFAELTVRVW